LSLIASSAQNENELNHKGTENTEALRQILVHSSDFCGVNNWHGYTRIARSGTQRVPESAALVEFAYFFTKTRIVIRAERYRLYSCYFVNLQSSLVGGGCKRRG
jgi:hypothetical protein